MARRSSARIRAKASATPQPQKVSDMGVQGLQKTPRTAPKLSSLHEDEETPSRPAETPRDGTPIRPSPEEMHPQKYQMSTAKPLDEARWLGFSSTKATHQTPTKTPRQTLAHVLDKAPQFDFTFSRPTLQMSPEAHALMAEKKEEAAKIRQQMAATQHGQPSASDVLGRKLATPTAKVSRFSDVHMQAFKKMDSIATHPSALRKQAPAARTQTSLKRSPSKAELEQPSAASTSLPRPTSRGNLDTPAKRVKRADDDDDDAAAARPATPKDTKIIGRSIKPPPSLQKSVRRTTMIGSSLPRSPAKMGMTSASLKPPAAPLLSKSPIKSPVKAPLKAAAEEPEAPESPLLSRSPVKSQAPIKPAEEHAAESPAASSKLPYLARSPSKKSVADYAADYDAADARERAARRPDKGPLLSRSPSKMSMPLAESSAAAGDKTPAKPSLLTRFNLLRASPVKSILRTPQRLYSDDPFQVAKGTHLATPPNAVSDEDKPHPQRPPKTAPVIKHVDFSASTKGLSLDKGLDNLDTAPNTPTKAPTPPSKHAESDGSAISYPALPSADASSADAPTAKKAHRRMTMAAPSDFTFRAGAAISFAPSPRRVTSNGPKPSIRHVSAEPDMQPAAAKKRKISDVAQDGPSSAPKGSSDKENDDEDARPAKKARSVAPEKHVRPSVAPAKTPTRKVPTIGVKPKAASTSKPKEKRPGMLSAARLAMLATPKRR